jgi:hypothetical protein
MAMWDKLKTELDKAGRVAQDAIDEGKIRLEAFRVRQMADKAAQALGYAVYRARKSGQELDTDSYARLSSALAGHEAEAARLEAELAEVAARTKAEASAADSTTAGSPPPTV